MIKTVIFDIGRVLVDWDWENFVKKLYPDDEEKATAVGRSFFAHPCFVEFDRGVWQTREVLDKIIGDAPEYKDEILYTFSRMGETILVRDTTIPWIKSLKEQGLNVLYLSNYSVPMRDLSREKLKFTDYMDGGVFSCDVKMVKPDRNIYEYIIKKYGLVPEECIFIDDMEDNIATAINLGIHGIRYVTYEQAKSDMEKIINGCN